MTTKKRRRVLSKTNHGLLHRTNILNPYLNPRVLADRSIKNDSVDKAIKKLDYSRKYNVDMAQAYQIGRKCIQKLISMNLANCYINDQHLEAMFVSGKNTINCDRESVFPLRKINLENTGVTDLGVRLVALHCPQLSRIVLKGCHKITNLSLSILAQNCKNLKQVVLSECKISNYAVQIIAQECKSNLQVLDLTDCSQITDEAVIYLAYHCPNLKCLKLRGTKVTTQSLTQVLTRTALHDLNLQGIPIDDTIINIIAKNQKLLHFLNLSFCHQITSQGIKSMCIELPYLKELHLFGIQFAPQLSKEILEQNAQLKICL